MDPEDIRPSTAQTCSSWIAGDDVNTTLASPTPNKLNITRRADKTIRMHILHFVIKPLRPHLVSPKKSASNSGSPRLTPPRRVTRKCAVHERRLNGVWVYDVAKSDASKSTAVGGATERKPLPRIVRQQRVFYFAGGGWQQPPSGEHWSLVSELAQRLPNNTITLVSSPLAPSCPAFMAMEQLKTLYGALMDEAAESGQRVVFMGDSSGGNIILSLVIWVLGSPGARAPASLMCISPTTDLRHRHPGLEAAARGDPVLTLASIKQTAEVWMGKNRRNVQWGAEDPRVSPALASLDGLIARGVKVHGVIGMSDVLAIEAADFRDRCVKEGIDGEWLEWEGQMHCFPLAFRYGLTESLEALDWIIKVLNKW